MLAAALSTSVVRWGGSHEPSTSGHRAVAVHPLFALFFEFANSPRWQTQKLCLYANHEEVAVELELSLSVEARAVVGDESTAASRNLGSSRAAATHAAVVEQSVCIETGGPVAG